jgi:hypothetical protein
MKNLMRTPTGATLPAILAIAVFLRTTPLVGQQLEVAPGHQTANEFYAPSLTPAIYLINFLFLYTANPDIAAYLPAYKAPVPQPVIDCLEQNPTGCPYAPFRQYFEEQARSGGGNAACFWPEVCQEEAKWQALAPRKFRKPEEINEPLGRARADQLAHLLGITDSMILTEAEYQCLIGTPPRSDAQEIIFTCIYNLTNSKGNALIPLSSYGLNVTEQGAIRSVCATNAPCLNFNALLAGPLEQIAAQCGFLDKLVRMEAGTPFRQFLVDGQRCQTNAGAACFVEATCAGK